MIPRSRIDSAVKRLQEASQQRDDSAAVDFDAIQTRSNPQFPHKQYIKPSHETNFSPRGKFNRLWPQEP